MGGIEKLRTGGVGLSLATKSPELDPSVVQLVSTTTPAESPIVREWIVLKPASRTVLETVLEIPEPRPVSRHQSQSGIDTLRAIFDAQERIGTQA